MSIGRYLSNECARFSWGDSFIVNLADQIQKNYPEIRGFNQRGLYRMRQFFETYKDNNKLVPNWNQSETFKHRPTLPYAFTEHGILMLSSILKSDKAITVNIQIMKIFVQMRHYALSQTPINDQIAELRKLLMLYIEKNDKRVNEIIIALNNLIEQPSKPKRIGFRANDEKE